MVARLADQNWHVVFRDARIRFQMQVSRGHCISGAISTANLGRFPRDLPAQMVRREIGARPRRVDESRCRNPDAQTLGRN